MYNATEKLAGVVECIRSISPKDDRPADVIMRDLDSLSLVELVVAVEEHFAIEIPDLMLTDEAFTSAQALASLVARCGGPSRPVGD